MIVINFYKDKLLVEGHAGYAEYGKDILCAGVSAIVCGAINWFDEDDINYKMTDGLVEINIINKTPSNLQKLELIKIQLLSLEDKQYKGFIKFIDNMK